jgi:hypothetical protein
MSKREKLSGCRLVIGVEREHRDYGMLYPQCIASVRLPTPIFGLPMMRFSQISGIKALARTVAKPVILNGLTVRCVSVCRAWSGERYRSPKSWRITLAQFGTLFTTTMHPYIFRTTLLLNWFKACTLRCALISVTQSPCSRE